MFVRAKRRFEDGKEHVYWSVVENCRNRDGRVVQRQVLHLGEINDSQRAAWCRSIEVLGGDSGPASMALFADDREAPELDCEVVRVRVTDLSPHRPRQWGACRPALTLWERLDLDRFWRARLPPSRRGTRWLDVLKTLACYQLIDPGSEWRLHRHWYGQSAMRDLLDSPMEVVADDTPYRCLDKLVEHKRAFFSFLRERWETLFDARFDVLLHDPTSTYFETDPPFADKRRFGYSRDKRPDCVQVVIALVVTPQGFPLAYMQLSGVEQAFKELKHDLAVRPVFHRNEERIEAHIFVAFVAYCLHVTLKNLARPCAPGLTPRAILEKFSTLQMVDVHLPTADGRHLTPPRHTQPTRDHRLLLDQLKLRLPEQPPPRISV